MNIPFDYLASDGRQVPHLFDATEQLSLAGSLLGSCCVALLRGNLGGSHWLGVFFFNGP